jgi:FSR family fosmidomycin resistance protein-like MFS transporter
MAGWYHVIWSSILGVLPFTLIMPHANLFWTGVLSAVIGIVIASAFSAIIVYAQEMMPGRVGLVSGIFFGIAFGMGRHRRGSAEPHRRDDQHHLRL